MSFTYFQSCPKFPLARGKTETRTQFPFFSQPIRNCFHFAISSAKSDGFPDMETAIPSKDAMKNSLDFFMNNTPAFRFGYERFLLFAIVSAGIAVYCSAGFVKTSRQFFNLGRILTPQPVFRMAVQI